MPNPSERLVSLSCLGGKRDFVWTGMLSVCLSLGSSSPREAGALCLSRQMANQSELHTKLCLKLVQPQSGETAAGAVTSRAGESDGRGELRDQREQRGRSAVGAHASGGARSSCSAPKIWSLFGWGGVTLRPRSRGARASVWGRCEQPWPRRSASLQPGCTPARRGDLQVQREQEAQAADEILEAKLMKTCRDLAS